MKQFLKRAFFLLARRFIAGEKIEDLIKVAKKKEKEGFLTVLNILGEHAKTYTEVFAARDEIFRLLHLIKENEIKSNIAIKLSCLGIEFKEALAEDITRQIIEKAHLLGISVEFDAEEPKYKVAVERIFRKVASFQDRICIQASENDDRMSLLRLSAVNLIDGKPCFAQVRLCKGAYRQLPEETARRRFLEHLPILLIYGRNVAVATHDSFLHERTKMLAGGRGFEFQMLLGLYRYRAKKLLNEGYPVRLYISAGPNWLLFIQRRKEYARRKLASILKDDIYYYIYKIVEFYQKSWDNFPSEVLTRDF